MGIIISRFRKKQTTAQVLENLEKKILSIEEFQKVTQRRQRKVVGRLVLYSLGLYLLVVLIYYAYFTPASIRENLLYFTPLLIFPIVIYTSKKFITWYYNRRLEKNDEVLSDLKSKKKKVLEEVMNTETYKIAKELLEKYAPDQLNKEKKLGSNFSNSSSKLGEITENNQLVPFKNPVMSNSARTMNTSTSDSVFEAVPNKSIQNYPKIPLARPILSQNRGPLDKLVDMLIGDGPNNRYALICKICGSHNGMALKHEFEFLAFRCAYCLQFNPARKQKPHSPNISRVNTGLSHEIDQLDTAGNADEAALNTSDIDVEEIQHEDSLHGPNTTMEEDSRISGKANFNMKDLQSALSEIQPSDDEFENKDKDDADGDCDNSNLYNIEQVVESNNSAESIPKHDEATSSAKRTEAVSES